MIKKFTQYVSNIFVQDRFVEEQSKDSRLIGKVRLQLTVFFAFLLLTAANILSKSYFMMIFTMLGCVINLVSALIAKKTKKGTVCSFVSIISCSVMFAFFVIYGGNDGFACLWVILVPFFSMVVLDFIMGFCASVFFQIFLIVVFWTPVRYTLFYSYNDQFCLRFPLFFFVTFILGLVLTLSLRRSQYNELKQLQKLEELTEVAHRLARIDTLTELSNRRNAYEEFKTNFSENGTAHCIVMGDIDFFKNVNDTYGHEFGDDALVIFADFVKNLLPSDYLKSRWGGEEFLFAANEPIDIVYDRIEKLRKAIAEHEFMHNGKPVHITVTFGIAEYTDANELEKAIHTADNMLYKGKHISRNCTVYE